MDPHFDPLSILNKWHSNYGFCFFRLILKSKNYFQLFDTHTTRQANLIKNSFSFPNILSVFFPLSGSNHLPVINDENGGLARMSTTCRGPGADWSSNASSVSHIFVHSSSGDSCYLADECKYSGKNETGL